MATQRDRQRTKVLTGKLRRGNAATRCRAARALGVMQWAKAVPLLIRVLKDPEPKLRASAAWGLARMGTLAKAAVPALIDVLGDSDFQVRVWAPWALGEAGPPATKAVPALIEALAAAWRNDEPEVQIMCAWALGRIGESNQEVVATLRTALADGHPAVQATAAWSLGALGPAASEAVPVLVEATFDSDRYIRVEAAAALGNIAAYPELAVPALVRALRGRGAAFRRNAARALGQFGRAAAPAVKALIKLLRHRDLELRVAAAVSLGQIGPAAVSAATALAAAQKDRSDVVKKATDRALLLVLAPKESIARPAAVTGAPAGIERMGDEAVSLIPRLKTFYLIGEDCRQRQDYTFTFTEVAALSGEDDWTLRRDLDAVSKFFRRYFSKFGFPEGNKVEVAPDREELTSESHKLKVIDRGRGKWRMTLCEPLGRAALALAGQFLREVRQLPPPWRRNA